jgi:hypothetical protein
MGTSTLEPGAVAARLHMTPPTKYLGLVILDSGGAVADEGPFSAFNVPET